MTRFRGWWQEWMADNPFVRRELRRWGRRGYAWKMPLWNAALPALVISAAQGVYVLGPAWLRTVLPPDPGVLMFGAVALVHLFLVFSFGSSLLSLYQEALAERLDFVRALPLGHRELLLKMGVARSLLLAATALAGLPAYLIALSYGGVDALDVATWYALLFALVIGPPAALDVTMARSARRATDPGAARQANLDPLIVFRMVFIQVFIQAFLVSRRHHSFGILSRVLPPGASGIMRLFPFALFPAAIRFLWVPRPFYHLTLPPLALLAAWWLLHRVTQATAVAELWAREPVVEALPQERTLVTFPEETGRERERRAARRLGMAGSALFFLSVAGFAWEPMVETGRLGILVGSATPAGSAAALFLIWACKGVLNAVHRIRWQCLSPFRPAKETPDEAGLQVGRPLLFSASLALAACLFGGVWPWPDLPLAGAGLLLASASALLFAVGWRAALGPEPHRIRLGANVALAFGELALLFIPLGVLFLGARALYWHLPAALSPVYAFASLFPGLWSSPPLPPAAAAALPAAFGGVLLLVSLRRAPAKADEAGERTRRDPLDTRVDRVAQRWDNALFLLEVRRQLRKPTGLTLRAFGSLLGVFLFSAFFVGIVALPMVLSSSGSGLTPLQRLGHAGRSPVTPGILMSLMGSGIIVAMTAMQGVMQLTGGVREEYATAKNQCRLPFLAMSGLSDRDIVFGVLAARLLRAAPLAAAAVAVSLFWCLFGLPFGMPWWGPAVWTWAMLLIVTTSLTLALHTFHAWRGFDWVAVFTALTPVMPMVLIFGAQWARRLGLLDWVIEYRWEVLAVVGITPVVLAVLVPRSVRSAISAVNRCRTRRDVDIPTTAPSA